jgi:hypothetical protein
MFFRAACFAGRSFLSGHIFLESSVVKAKAALQSDRVRSSDGRVHRGRLGVWADHELWKPDIALGLSSTLFQKSLGKFFDYTKHDYALPAADIVFIRAFDLPRRLLRFCAPF